MNPLRAVLFDLGDTLWHFPRRPSGEELRRLGGERLARCFAEHGLAVEDPAALWADVRDRLRALTRRAILDDALSLDYVEMVRAALATAGLPGDRALAEAAWGAWNLGGAAYGRELLAEALPTLEQLTARGLFLGCVTNRAYGGPRFRAELEECGLSRYFATLQVSCDAGLRKPQPAIFLRAAADLGVAPEQTAVVGDSLRADVWGAHRAGMWAVWRQPSSPAEEDRVWPVAEGDPSARPDLVVGSVADLLTHPAFGGA